MFKKADAVYDISPRAGVHVHVNVNDLTMKQVMTMVCAYIILEEFFISFCDKSRDGNLFCLPSYNAEYLISAIRNTCSSDDLAHINTDDVRYASINLRSLFKYGSVEFRSLESTPDFDKVNTWVQMLYKLKEAAKRFKDPQDLIMSFSRNDYIATMNNIMEEYSPTLQNNIGDIHKVLRNGIVRAQDIAFSRNWDTKNLNIFKKSTGVFN
jgi:hypothetical protein